MSYIQKIKKLIGIEQNPKVGWLLLGDMNVASSRIHGINIHKYLLKKSVESIIYQTNQGMVPLLTLSGEEQRRLLSSDIDILIFQKVFGDKAVAFAGRAKERGIKTIFLLSDKHETEMVTAVDQLVVTSDFLKEFFDANYGTDAVVIEDALEGPENFCKEHVEKKTLQLVWTGHGDNWHTLDIIRDVLAKMGNSTFALKTISNHPDADVQWELDSVFNEILTGDVAVIPANNDEWAKAKSNNRLTMFMALGLPVIASPIPTYTKIVNNGKNSFLAATTEEWMQCLLLLKDARLRQRIGMQARSDVLASYSIEVIGKQWTSLLSRMGQTQNA